MEAVYAAPGDPATALDAYSGPSFDPSQFFGSFWSPDAPSLDVGFEEMRKYLRQGNDFLKDIVDLFQQRCVAFLPPIRLKSDHVDMHWRRCMARSCSRCTPRPRRWTSSRTGEMQRLHPPTAY
jgi:hypothetical protein